MAKKVKEDYKHLTKRGGVWWLQATHKGKRIYKTTGQESIVDARKVRDAELERFTLDSEKDQLAIISKRITGIDTRLEEIADGLPAMTMLQAWNAFKVAPKGRTPRGRVIMPGKRTLADYEGRWNAFCTWMDKNYPKEDKDGIRIPWELRRIEKEHAERYIAEIGGGKSANTRNKTLTFLRLVFKVLAADARIKANPFEGMDAAPLAVTRKRPLTMTELGTISKNLAGKGEMETLFALGYYTGARLGDCVLMRWSSIDMGARKIRYTPHKTAKGNKEITLTISPALFALLDQTPSAKRKGFVLPELGELYQKDPAAVSKRIQQVFVDAGIETDLEVEGYGKKVACVGFHSLRHAHITALLESGLPMDAVRQQVGHATIGMTAHYYHASEKTLQATAAALPDIGAVKTLPEGADATGAILDGILGQLDKLSVEQLATLAEKVRETTDKRTYKQLTGAASAVAK